MILSSLFIVCSHGRRSAHGPFDTKGESLLPGGWCQGGRPVTLSDLQEFGETVIVTASHRCVNWASGNPITPGTYLLIPIDEVRERESV